MDIRPKVADAEDFSKDQPSIFEQRKRKCKLSRDMELRVKGVVTPALLNGVRGEAKVVEIERRPGLEDPLRWTGCTRGVDDACDVVPGRTNQIGRRSCV